MVSLSTKFSSRHSFYDIAKDSERTRCCVVELHVLSHKCGDRINGRDACPSDA